MQLHHKVVATRVAEAVIVAVAVIPGRNVRSLLSTPR